MIHSFLIQFLAPILVSFCSLAHCAQLYATTTRSPAAAHPSTLLIDAGVPHSRVFVSDYHHSGVLYLSRLHDNSTVEIRNVRCSAVHLSPMIGRCAALLPCSIDLSNVTAYNASAARQLVTLGDYFHNVWLRLSQIAYFEIYFYSTFTASNATVLVERSVLTGIIVNGVRGGNFDLRIEKNIFANYSSNPFYALIQFGSADILFSVVSIRYNEVHIESATHSTAQATRAIVFNPYRFLSSHFSLVQNAFATFESHIDLKDSEQIHSQVELWRNTFGFLRLSGIGPMPVEPHIVVGNTIQNVSNTSLCTSSAWFCACNSFHFVGQRFCSRALAVNRCSNEFFSFPETRGYCVPGP